MMVNGTQETLQIGGLRNEAAPKHVGLWWHKAIALEPLCHRP